MIPGQSCARFVPHGGYSAKLFAENKDFTHRKRIVIIITDTIQQQYAESR